MDSARFCDSRGGGAQVQVVGVCKDNFGLDVLKLRWSDRFDGRFGAHRHKNRRCHVAVVGMDHAKTRF